MALPTTRKQLREWCLRKLGEPVLQINVSDEQVDDRISEGLAYFRDYHFDGVEKLYLQRKVTASVMTLSSPISTTAFTKNDILVGNTSGAEAHFFDISDNGLTLRFKTKKGVFTLGETITNSRNSLTAVISNTPIVIGDCDNGYLPIDDRVISISSIIKVRGLGFGMGVSAGAIFDYSYQWAMNNMYTFASADLVTYYIYKSYMALWGSLFKTEKEMHFNRKMNKLTLVGEDLSAHVDQYIVIDCLAALDPEEYSKIYGDEFVRDYVTALIKQQWGTNLKKLSGIQLPGGVTLNGQIIYDEATAELEKLQERAKKEFQVPPMPFIA